MFCMFWYKMVDFPIRSRCVRTKIRLLFWKWAILRIHSFFQIWLVLEMFSFQIGESTILNDSCPSFKMYNVMFQGHHEDSGVIHELLMSDAEVMRKSWVSDEWVMGAAHVMGGSRELDERIASSWTAKTSTGALLTRVGRRLQKKITDDSQWSHGWVTIEAWVLLTWWAALES